MQDRDPTVTATAVGRRCAGSFGAAVCAARGGGHPPPRQSVGGRSHLASTAAKIVVVQAGPRGRTPFADDLTRWWHAFRRASAILVFPALGADRADIRRDPRAP